MREVFITAFTLFGLTAAGFIIGYVVSGILYLIDWSLDLWISYQVLPRLQIVIMVGFMIATPIVGGSLLL